MNNTENIQTTETRTENQTNIIDAAGRRYEFDQIDMAIVFIGIMGIIAIIGMICTDKNFSDLVTNFIIAIGSLATGRTFKK